MNIDTLYELGDIAILVVLWLSLGGELAVLAYLCYAVTGLLLGLAPRTSA